MASILTAVVNQVVQSANADALAELERGPAFTIHMVMLVFSLLLMVSFWAAYGWSILLAMLCFINGVASWYHLQSVAALKAERCCCGPVRAITYICWMDIFGCFLGPIAVITGILGIFFFDPVVVRIFAGLSVAASIALTMCCFMGWFRMRRLEAICLEYFQPALFPIPIVQTAPVYPVYPPQPQPYSVQPYGQPAQTSGQPAQPYGQPAYSSAAGQQQQQPVYYYPSSQQQQQPPPPPYNPNAGPATQEAYPYGRGSYSDAPNGPGKYV